MLNFCNLYSGSSGNCSFIESENAKILIDCGNSCKKITEGLESINKDIKDLDGILITHEHLDHVKGLAIISKKYNIPIYANERTLNSINQDISLSPKNIFKTNEQFEIKDLKIYPFSIPHDAADPCGFSVSHDNKKLTIATDIGHIEKSTIDNLVGSDFVLLESNYEPEMLKCSKYPYMLKRRILGPNGHLSNEDAGEVISILVKNGIDNVMLGHLSQQNNFPELAYKTVVESLISNKIDTDKVKLSVANRTAPDSILNISKMEA